jgi:hypothetical protein
MLFLTLFFIAAFRMRLQVLGLFCLVLLPMNLFARCASSGLAGRPDSGENDGQRITVQSIAAVSKRSGHRSNPEIN